MNRLLLIAAVVASACEALAQSPGMSSRSPVRPTSPTSPTSPEGIDATAAEEAVRRAVWHSTEMLDAREYVLDYCERSARSSRAQGEQYLRRVSELSSEQMLEWLERLQHQRVGLEGRRQAEDAARSLSVGLATDRLRQSAQAGINAGQAKAWMAEAWQQQTEELAAKATPSRRSSWGAALAGQRLAYDAMAPSLDPASPPRSVRAMAAASLPGDLPRGDPANFYRGDDRGAAPPGGDGATSGGDGAGSGGAGGVAVSGEVGASPPGLDAGGGSGE